MAIAYDNSTKGGQTGGSPASITFSHTVNSNTNGLLFVCVKGDAANYNTFTDPTVTYSGVSMTLYASYTANDANSGQIKVYYLVAPATGANNVVITQGATKVQFLAGTAASYTGVNQSTPIDVSGTNSTTATGTFTTSATTTVDNDWGVLFIGGGGSIAASTNTTTRITALASPWDYIGDTNAVQTPTGSKSMSVTVSTGDSAACISRVVFISPASTTAIKTVNGLAVASVKTVNGLATASVKTVNGLA